MAFDKYDSISNYCVGVLGFVDSGDVWCEDFSFHGDSDKNGESVDNIEEFSYQNVVHLNEIVNVRAAVSGVVPGEHDSLEGVCVQDTESVCADFVNERLSGGFDKADRIDAAKCSAPPVPVYVSACGSADGVLPITVSLMLEGNVKDGLSCPSKCSQFVDKDDSVVQFSLVSKSKKLCSKSVKFKHLVKIRGGKFFET